MTINSLGRESCLYPTTETASVGSKGSIHIYQTAATIQHSGEKSLVSGGSFVKTQRRMRMVIWVHLQMLSEKFRLGSGSW